MEINFSGVNGFSWLGKSLRLPLRLVPDGMVLRVLQGPMRGARWIAGASNHGCWLGSYEFDKQRVFQRLVREGSVVYDIGANVGFYTLLASRLAGPSGKVYAFEPLPRNCILLRRHVELNRAANVSVMEVAVSSSHGEAFFDPGANHSMGHLADQGVIRVHTVALDRFIQDRAMPPPDLIKIDVEGAEAEVLTGACQTLGRHRPIILLATHGEAVHEECRRILRDYGFAVESLDGNPIEQSAELIAHRPVTEPTQSPALGS